MVQCLIVFECDLGARGQVLHEPGPGVELHVEVVVVGVEHRVKCGIKLAGPATLHFGRPVLNELCNGLRIARLTCKLVFFHDTLSEV